MHRESDELLLALSKRTYDNWKQTEQLQRLSDEGNDLLLLNELRAKAAYYFVLREIRNERLVSNPKYMYRY
ncbi:hypothetical protein BCAMP_11080 [Brochothrix campestris FSL F6-1037]|uniref:DUF2508 family protein n=2 Tax=Brochothrix campestris TaxID=2757 RepID=W7CSN7_9LIST|nr:hypothetical protein BCAMP_11080 [Brochothrix campestris FSL F6-1037]